MVKASADSVLYRHQNTARTVTAGTSAENTITAAIFRKQTKPVNAVHTPKIIVRSAHRDITAYWDVCASGFTGFAPDFVERALNFALDFAVRGEVPPDREEVPPERLEVLPDRVDESGIFRRAKIIRTVPIAKITMPATPSVSKCLYHNTIWRMVPFR